MKLSSFVTIIFHQYGKKFSLQRVSAATTQRVRDIGRDGGENGKVTRGRRKFFNFSQ
jgi:hypothetical protein